MNDLLILACLMVPLLILGIFGNINLLIVTIKYKQFHHRNGILLGMIAFLDLVNDLYEAMDAIRIFLGVSLLTRKACFDSIAIYQFSYNLTCIANLSLAVDRLIAVILPMKYRTIKTSNYILITVIICCIYALPFVIAGYLLVDKTLVNPCNPPVAYSPKLSQIWNFSYFAIAMCVIVINLICMVRLKCYRKRKSYDSSFQRREAHTTITMFVLLAIYVIGCFLSSTIIFTANHLPIPQKLKEEISTYVALFVLIDYGCNYYVLFWRSEEYRIAFIRQFRHNSWDDSVMSIAHTNGKTRTSEF